MKYSILELKIPSFTKIDNYACQTTYGKYGTRKEADFACASDSKCKFVQSVECVYPNDFGHFKLCGYDSSLIFSTPSCVYQKEDINRSGNSLTFYSSEQYCVYLISYIFIFINKHNVNN